jgi:hypothetical protein
MGTMLRPRNLIKPAARYPADPRAVFILALSIFSGVATLLAQKAPGTLESVMPNWGVVIWGVTLTLGSALALLGLWFDSDNGIITEQIGSVMVGVATIFYAAVAVWVAGLGASQPTGIVLAWGLACFIRWLQLQLLIHDEANKRLVGRVQEELNRGSGDI